MAAATDETTPKASDWGFAYHNPDTGMEWAADHPVRSGEVEDATDVRRMTYGGFRRRHQRADAAADARYAVADAMLKDVPPSAYVARRALGLPAAGGWNTAVHKALCGSLDEARRIQERLCPGLSLVLHVAADGTAGAAVDADGCYMAPTDICPNGGRAILREVLLTLANGADA